MAVEAVVFDISGTVLAGWSTPQPGIVDTLDELRALNITLVAAVNESRDFTLRKLQATGLRNRFTHVVTHDDIGKNKGSPAWTDAFLRLTGLRANQFLYIGDTKEDMITATRGPMLYAHAAWAAAPGPYGLIAPAPGWVVAVVRHIFRKRHRWYWTLDATDPRGRPIRAFTLVDANGGGDLALRTVLLNLLKSDRDAPVGPMTLRQFVMLHMLASVYDADLFGGVEIWTTYPGHTGTPNAVMGDFLDVAAKLSRNTYRGDLFDRHRPALRSKDAYDRGGHVGALRNQLDTMRLNSAYRTKLDLKQVLVLDNFLTRGHSVEAARNLLRAADAREVVVACVGKYRTPYQAVSPPPVPWDPFATTPPEAAGFVRHPLRGVEDEAALAEFVASYHAMHQERW